MELSNTGVSTQGQLSMLNFPQFRQQSTSLWILTPRAIFKFYQDGGNNQWFDDDPYFAGNLQEAYLQLPASSKSEALFRIDQEIQILTTLRTLIK